MKFQQVFNFLLKHCEKICWFQFNYEHSILSKGKSIALRVRFHFLQWMNKIGILPGGWTKTFCLLHNQSQHSSVKQRRFVTHHRLSEGLPLKRLHLSRLCWRRQLRFSNPDWYDVKIFVINGNSNQK